MYVSRDPNRRDNDQDIATTPNKQAAAAKHRAGGHNPLGKAAKLVLGDYLKDEREDMTGWVMDHPEAFEDELPFFLDRKSMRREHPVGSKSADVVADTIDKRTGRVREPVRTAGLLPPRQGHRIPARPQGRHRGVGRRARANRDDQPRHLPEPSLRLRRLPRRLGGRRHRRLRLQRRRRPNQSRGRPPPSSWP